MIAHFLRLRSRRHGWQMTFRSNGNCKPTIGESGVADRKSLRLRRCVFMCCAVHNNNDNSNNKTHHLFVSGSVNGTDKQYPGVVVSNESSLFSCYYPKMSPDKYAQNESHLVNSLLLLMPVYFVFCSLSGRLSILPSLYTVCVGVLSSKAFFFCFALGRPQRMGKRNRQVNHNVQSGSKCRNRSAHGMGSRVSERAVFTDTHI